jgi:hypothetical protein
MSAATVETILAQANQLSAEERAKLISKLKQVTETEYVIPEGRIISTNAPYTDRSLEFKWMKEHEHEYAGQWVAVKGDKLIAHGSIAKEVFAKARESGAPDAIVYLVNDSDLPYMGF